MHADNIHMTKMFRSFQVRALFIGLTQEEMINVEISFSRYSVSYKPSLQLARDLSNYDMICMPDEAYEEHKDFIKSFEVPVFTIGENKSDSSGLLRRPQYVREWLEVIEPQIKPVKKPELNTLEVGAVVRSKTTPDFGKGIVVELVGTDEAMVKFPMNKLLSKLKILRCHKSQLQILGNIKDIDMKKNTQAKSQDKRG